MGKVIARIPLTGGPKGGKTKVKEEIKKLIEKKYGYRVFLVPETATEIIGAGFIPAEEPDDNDSIKTQLYVNTNLVFQQIILNLQLEKEKSYELAAQSFPEDAVIIYDRAVMDNKGYLMMRFGDNGIFEDMLSKHGLTVDEIMSRYDTILSLGTSARITDFNTNALDDNTIRIESGTDEAMKVDYFVSKAWEKHPNYVRIEAKASFEEKVAAVLEEIEKALDRAKVKKLGAIIKPD